MYRILAALSVVLFLPKEPFVFGALSRVLNMEISGHDSAQKKQFVIESIKGFIHEVTDENSIYPSELEIPIRLEDKIETYENKLTRREIANLPPKMFLNYVANFDEEVEQKRLHCLHAERHFVHLANKLYVSAVEIHNLQASKPDRLYHLKHIDDNVYRPSMSKEREEWITRIYFILEQSLHENSPIYETLPALCGALARYRESWYPAYKLALENVTKGFTVADKLQYAVRKLTTLNTLAPGQFWEW